MPGVGLALLSGILLTLLYPPFSIAVVGWVALAPLLVALDGAPPRRALYLGWVTGTVGSLGITGYWMYRAAHDYFAMSPVTAVLFTFAVNQAFVSLYFAAFALIASAIRRDAYRLIGIPAAFVASEYARAHGFGGNPWALLGQSQDTPLLMQICDVSGVYGLSFLLALSAFAIACGGRSRRPLAVAAGLSVLVLAYGAWRLHQDEEKAETTLAISLVQGGIVNSERGEPRYFASHLQSYLDLTRTLRASALIIWPENAVGFFPEENPGLVNSMRGAIGSAPLLFGAPRGAGSAGVAALYNSAHLLSGNELRVVYDKRVLLPFVESMPLRSQDGPYLAGDRPGVFAVDAGKLGVLICYEALYADRARELAAAGIQILVNVSNDSWFDAGAGPEQHFQAAKFRAVENRVSLVRVTNSGVSGVIDPSGHEVRRLPQREPAAQTVSVPLGSGDSFYARHGDVFAISCIALAALALWRGH